MVRLGLFSEERGDLARREPLGFEPSASSNKEPLDWEPSIKGELLGWETSQGVTVLIGPMLGFPIPGMSKGGQSHGEITLMSELSARELLAEAWPPLPLPLKPPRVPRTAGEASRCSIAGSLVTFGT